MIGWRGHVLQRAAGFNPRGCPRRLKPAARTRRFWEVEGSKVEGSKVEGSKVEGSKVRRSKVKGSKVEGSKVEGSLGCPILRRRRRVGEGQQSRTVTGSIRPPPLLRKDGAPARFVGNGVRTGVFGAAVQKCDD